MKNHDEIRSMLAALAGGDLTAADLTLVEQHLAECEACRSELAQLQLVVQAVRETPDLEPPPWLATRIMARVREDAVQQQSWFRRLILPLRIKLPLEAFALVMICVTAWYVMQEVEHSRQVQTELKAPAAEAAKDTAVQAVPTQPSSAPAAAAPQALPDRQPYQPGAPALQEPPAAPAFAPPPQAAADMTELMDRAKAAPEAVPAAPSASREQAVGSAAPMAERKMASRRKAESSDNRFAATVSRPLRVRLVAHDQATVSEKLHVVVQSLAGTVVDSRPDNFLIRIEAARLPELLGQVEKLGRITERPVSGLSHPEWLELTIFWQVTEK